LALQTGSDIGHAISEHLEVYAKEMEF